MQGSQTGSEQGTFLRVSRPNIPLFMSTLTQRPAPRSELLAATVMRPRLGHRFPFRDPFDEIRIRFIANERPALFVAGAGDIVVVGAESGAVFDQCFGILEIAVDGLDGGSDAVFL